MGAQLSKGGVAVEGKAADPAAAKANGQVSKKTLSLTPLMLHHHRGEPHGTQRPPAWVPTARAHRGWRV